MYSMPAIAKILRKNMTDCERFLWNRLRARQLAGLKFRRQESIERYIVDFVCYEKRLIIELDGGQHADAEEKIKDNTRTQWLEQQGFRVLRFWNNDVLQNIEGVLETIVKTITPPSFPPARGGREEKRYRWQPR